MDAFVDAAISFVTTHRDWVGPIAFFFAFAETLAFLSIIIPSTAILIGVGAVVATGAIDFLPLWIGGALGSITGSILSYWLGWKFGKPILSVWPMNTYPELVEKGRHAFAKYGIIAVLIGHFFGPLRAVVFIMAGVARMNPVLFLPVNFVAAVLWAFIIPKTGEFGGNALHYLWTMIAGR